MLQSCAFSNLAPQRALVRAVRVEWLRVQLSQPCEVSDDESFVVGVPLEKEVALDCQALELARIVAGAVECRLGANLG